MRRLPRFKRSPAVPAFQLTNRDREILGHVHRHRFLRSDHLVALTGGSRQQVLRRLQLLFHHGYLERPACQIDYYQSGSRRMAYGLGNRGAAWLKREQSLPFHQLDWKRKGHVGRLFLEHALLVSDIMVAIELACRNRPDVKLLQSDACQRQQFSWNVNIGSKCSVIPDRVFGLEFGGKQCWYFLEADRATMPVTRADLSQTSIQRKLLAYEATWAQNIHQSRFGWQRFRVLTVTTKAERIPVMQEACQRLRRGKGIFVFSDLKTIQEQSDLFSLQWNTYLPGEMQRLVE